jgi:hypothetical protein
MQLFFYSVAIQLFLHPLLISLPYNSLKKTGPWALQCCNTIIFGWLYWGICWDETHDGLYVIMYEWFGLHVVCINVYIHMHVGVNVYVHDVNVCMNVWNDCMDVYMKLVLVWLCVWMYNANVCLEYVWDWYLYECMKFVFCLNVMYENMNVWLYLYDCMYECMTWLYDVHVCIKYDRDVYMNVCM